MTDRPTAWNGLKIAAEEWSKARTTEQGAALSEAAKQWAVTCGYREPKPTAENTEAVVPFGRDKGKPLSEVSDRDLQWLEKTVAANVEDPTRAKFREKNEKLLEAIREELESR